MPTLVLVHEAVEGPSGMGRVVESMAEVALDADWSVSLIASRAPRRLTGACSFRRLPSFDAVPSLPQHLAWCTAAARVLRHMTADVIHVHSPFLMSWGNLMTCHHLAKPAKDRGVREYGTGVNGALRRVQRETVTVLDDILYRRRPTGTHLSFVSEFLKTTFGERYGSALGGWVLPPRAPAWRPVTTEERREARHRWNCGDGLVVGFLGGVDQRKGFGDAFELSREAGLFPLFAGQGTDNLTCEHGRGVGFVEPDDLLEACDVVVAPALFDAAPVAVLEPLARGIPVVVTPATGWAPTIARHGAGLVWDGTSRLSETVRLGSRVPQDAIRTLIDTLGIDGFRSRLLSAYETVAATRGGHNAK